MADQNAAYCEALVRRDDPDRWLASLFIPADRRPHVHALYAFALEIARVRETVSEPMLGEIRLQWWRDALARPDAEGVRANPVYAALADAVARFDLPEKPLLDLLEARAFDLYDDPFPTTAALDAYARATSSALFRLAAMILDPGEPADAPPAIEAAGRAYALTGILRALPWTSARGQLFIPLDMLKEHGAGLAEIAAGRPTPAIRAALADMRRLARENLAVFHDRIEGLPVARRPGFLPVALCEGYLHEMEKPGYDPFRTVVARPQWRRQWTLWRAAREWG
jgi:phytoene synthase